MKLFGSWTLNTAAVIAALSVVAQNMEVLTPYFGQYGGLAGVVVAALMAGLRAKTDKPLKERLEKK